MDTGVDKAERTEYRCGAAGSTQKYSPKLREMMDFEKTKILKACIFLGLLKGGSLSDPASSDSNKLERLTYVTQIAQHHKILHYDSSTGQIKINPDFDYLSCPDAQEVFLALEELIYSRIDAMWNGIHDFVDTGECQSEARHSNTFYDGVYANAVSANKFTRYMKAFSVPMAKSVFPILAQRHISSIVDVGGHSGGFCFELAKAFFTSNINMPTFINLDLPPLRVPFEDSKRVNNDEIGSAVRFCSFDFFSDRPPAADVYVLGHILHNWSINEQNLILSSITSSMQAGTSLLVYDAIYNNEEHDESDGNFFARFYDLQMRLATPQGRSLSKTALVSCLRKKGLVLIDEFLGDVGLRVLLFERQ
ncbi:MAG: methyltransferase [Pseudomonadota bacterium]